MSIKTPSEGILLVVLPPTTKEAASILQKAWDKIQREDHSMVIIDFSRANIITAGQISILLKIRAVVELKLCSVPHAIQGVFKVTRQDKLFTFAKDRHEALIVMAG